MNKPFEAYVTMTRTAFIKLCAYHRTAVHAPVLAARINGVYTHVTLVG